MMMYNKLAIVLGILITVLIIKQFLESGYFHSLQNILLQNNINNEQANIKFQQQLENVIKTTQAKINKASEQGIVEAFKSQSNNASTSDNSKNQSMGYLPSYLNRTNAVKLQLFYKTSCKYCTKFLPIWTQIINNLPNDATYEEIDCEKDIKKATENKITSVPTIILLVNNEKMIYMGDRSYEDINRFLRTNGVNLVQKRFEDFNDNSSGANNNSASDADSDTILNPHCPAVTFDKQIDIENDKYMYQIFNTNGQYGYAVGGFNNDKILTPYMAAYSTVDSYLSSLPDITNPNKNSYKNINECAQLYTDNIINFGLCDAEQLNNILEYQKKIDNGINTYRVSNTDYSTNTNVVNTIKKVCGFTQ